MAVSPVIVTQTIYGIGSATKSLVAAAVGRLVDEKKLSWDTLVKDVSPEFQHDSPPVTAILTAADILWHRCGLADGGTMSLAFQGDGEMLLPRSSLFDLFNHSPVAFPIRQSWDYFVWGYSLAGGIIERKGLRGNLWKNMCQQVPWNHSA